MRYKLFLCVLLVLSVSTASAQTETCPAIVQQALQSTSSACQNTGRNQACYGNILLEAQPQPGVDNFTFEKSGDITNVSLIKTLVLEPLNVETQTWGVAVLKLQANLPDTLPGQNVTFLLFGDVEIENAVPPAPEPVLLSITAASNANIRSGPSRNDAVIGSLTSGQTFTADGRNEAGDWLRIQIPQDTGTPKEGWVFADLVRVDGDVAVLLVAEAGQASPASPMQSFYFRSGIGDAPCAEAPDSGILIQTPEGVGRVALTVNGVDVQLGSTAYLTAQPNAVMNINLVEGSATVTSEGVTQYVPAGSQVSVPVDENLQAAGPPSAPQPYEEAVFNALPVSALEREIKVAAPISEEVLTQLTQLTPLSGSWLYESGSLSFGGSCPPGLSAGFFPSVSETVELDTSGGFDFETIYRQTNTEILPGTMFDSPAPGVFTMTMTEDGNSVLFTLRVVSPTLMEGELVINSEGCIITIPFTMRLL